MDFVIQWLWYLLAFVAGSAVARVIANFLNKRGDVTTSPPFRPALRQAGSDEPRALVARSACPS